jgi:hypothetical protein
VPTLPELQVAFRTALLGGDDAIAREAVQGDGLAPAARLAIYRHHVTDTLTQVLAGTFPVICRLVDPRFFAYAADRYLRAEPPTSSCLFEYGATFPDFLASFGPCRHLAYLPDVARLEWAVNVAFHADDASPLDPVVFAAVPEAAAGRLRLRLHPSVVYLGASWPVDRIWAAHQEGGSPGELRLVRDQVCLEVRRTPADEVTVGRLAPADFRFRQTLAASRCLADAVSAAAEVDPAFDLPVALTTLLGGTIVVEVGIEATEGAIA